MDWWTYGAGFLIIGVITFGTLWVLMGIEWNVEERSTKWLLIGSIPAWPIVLLVIVGVWISVLLIGSKPK